MTVKKPKLNSSEIVANKTQGSTSEAKLVPINLDKIRNFEKNPRIGANEKFEDIKAGIKSAGKYTGVIDVTRRPDEQFYITFFGAGTRLKALKELYSETGNLDFYNINVAVHPYPGEDALISHHLAENIKRSDLTFYEVAQSVLELKDEIEKNIGTELNDKAFCEITAEKYSYPVIRQRMQDYRFIVQLNEICPEAVQAGMGRPMLEGLKNVRKNLNVVCDKLEIKEHAEDIYTNAFFEFQGSESLNPSEIMEKCVDQISGTYSQLPVNKVWAVVNEETNAKIPADQKPKRSRGISLKFLPSSISGLVKIKKSNLILSLPDEPLDRTSSDYVEACVTFSMLLPLVSPSGAKDKSFMVDVRSMIGDLDAGMLESLDVKQYSKIIKGLNGIISKLNNEG